MQVVERATVAASVSWSDALDAARRAFRALADGAVDQPDQFEMRPDRGGELHIKGAYLRGSTVLCFKVATGGFPGADPTGFTVVLDAATGQLRWLLADDGLLTETRTAAAGALATARRWRGATPAGSWWSGPAARHARRSTPTSRRSPTSRSPCGGVDRARTAALADDVGAEHVDDLAAAVAASDIVVTATSSRTPLIQASWVRPGTHLTAVGSDTAGKQELAADLLARAEVVVCDDVALAAHAGELQHARPRRPRPRGHARRGPHRSPSRADRERADHRGRPVRSRAPRTPPSPSWSSPSWPPGPTDR